MPNYYIHLQAAAETMERLKASLPAGSPLTRKEADDLFDIAHTNRNYFAAGAYGPDLFVLLPDFLGDNGKVLQKIIEFVMTTWRTFDEEFYSHWEEWMTPVLDESSTLANGITGGMLGEISLALDTFGGAVMNLELGLITQMTDILGLLTSGTQTGYDEKSFFWSDMFHSRKTYKFARTLYSNAMQADNDKAPKQRAFALGWISHCATDVAGHPFVNAKCGGPYRTHWARHHLIENHMDASVYQQKHPQPATLYYDSFATSALHFSMAFRPDDKPWDDYDYFPSCERHPEYPLGETDGDKARRKQIFDVGTEPFPEHICELILKTMQDVYTGPNDQDGPQILRWDEGMHTEPGGRPTVKMLQNMYKLAFEYMKYTTSSGLSLRPPKPPDVITDHDLPRPPGLPDDGAGADPGDRKEITLLDILLAILAYAIWLAEVTIWVVTVLPSLVADLATWPLRELLHQLLVVPAWDLYMLSRYPLVMEGFLSPLPDEISRGLVELGNDETEALNQLRDDLNDEMGFAPTQDRDTKEPSGLAADRGAATQGFGLDPAYPRAMVTDLSPPASPVALPDANLVPSEFVAPWRYPHHNMAGMRLGWEAPRTHVGPYMQGQDAGILVGGMPGSDAPRIKFEQAATPAQTESVSASLMPVPGAHLGDPVDYGAYLIGQLTGHDAAKPLPDFNLEADRGYAFHCWDYMRHAPSIPPSPRCDKDRDYPDQWRCVPQIPTFLSGNQPPEQIRQQQRLIYERHGYQEPYTVPERYDPADNPHHRSTYDPLKRIAHRYITGDSPVSGGRDEIDLQVSEQEIKDVGMSPTGRMVKP